MAIYTLVFNIVQGNFVAPLVYGKTVELHPAIVLLAIPAGGQIAGIIGMFLVVPFLGVVATTWRLVLQVFDPDDGSSTLSQGDRAPSRRPSRRGRRVRRSGRLATLSGPVSRQSPRRRSRAPRPSSGAGDARCSHSLG